MTMTKRGWAKLVAVCACVIIILILLLLNGQELGRTVQLRLILFDVNLPNILFAVFTFLLGALAGMFAAFYFNQRRR